MTAEHTIRPAICPYCDKVVGPKHFYRSGKARCQNRRTWTKAKLFQLMGMLERGKSDAAIAKVFGCSEEAVNLARKRHQIAPRRLQTLPAREVARRMGVSCAKTVVHWIREEFLKARRGHGFGGRKMWYVELEDLLDFIADDRTWHVWRTDRIADPQLRRWADQVRGDVRFLTPTEFGARYFTSAHRVNIWIHNGWLPARRWGNWWIDSRVAATWAHQWGESDMPSRSDRQAEAAALSALQRLGKAA